MFLGKIKLGDNLVFTVNTHSATTGAATDADSAPSYRVYEDETATPLLTGTLAILDNANTTGFYTESIAVTTGNGFEEGKSYSIYIEATVATVTGTLTHHFETRTNTEAEIYTRLGTPAGASVSADVAAVEAQTDDIGVAGAGLTDVSISKIEGVDATTQLDSAVASSSNRRWGF